MFVNLPSEFCVCTFYIPPFRNMRIASAVASVLAFASFGEKSISHCPPREESRLTFDRLVLASGQYEAVRYCEAQTGICFSSFTFNGISYRVALPQSSTESEAIVQIVAPNSYGWVGFAWGGNMRFNPLTVTWKNGNNVVVSSRRAT